MVARIWFSDGAHFSDPTELLHLHELDFSDSRGRTPHPRLIAEILRDVDLAATSAHPDRASAPLSPEILANRSALLRALLPGATVTDGRALVAGYTLDLQTAGVSGPNGQAAAIPQKLPTPSTFPYADPDSDTESLAARAAFLASQTNGRNLA